MKKTKCFVIIILLGSIILFGGILMNNVAVLSNGGKMPVKSSYIFETDHHYGYSDKNEINFWFFSDIFKTSNSIFTDIFGTSSGIFSIGDYLMVIGIMITIMGLMSIIIFSVRTSMQNKALEEKK